MICIKVGMTFMIKVGRIVLNAGRIVIRVGRINLNAG